MHRSCRSTAASDWPKLFSAAFSGLLICGRRQRYKFCQPPIFHPPAGPSALSFLHPPPKPPGKLPAKPTTSSLPSGIAAHLRPFNAKASNAHHQTHLHAPRYQNTSRHASARLFTAQRAATPRSSPSKQAQRCKLTRRFTPGFTFTSTASSSTSIPPHLHSPATLQWLVLRRTPKTRSRLSKSPRSLLSRLSSP